MIEVSDATKEAWLSDSSVKTIIVDFPNMAVSVTNDQIIKDSLVITQEFCDGDTVEYIGCNASKLTIDIAGVTSAIKGQKITVSMKADDTDAIPVFCGYVESVTKKSGTVIKQIVCYDQFYKLNTIDMTEWYIAQTRMTLSDLLDAVLNYCSITKGTVDLGVAATLTCYLGENTEWLPQNISALDLLKSICQVAGVYGKLNSIGTFDVINADLTDESLFNLTFYKECDREEYYVHAADGVICTNNDSLIVTGEQYGPAKTGDCTNPYIIKNNVLSNSWTDQKTIVVSDIYNKIKNFTYYPYSLTCLSLPFVECGDRIEIAEVTNNGDGTWTTVDRILYVMKRTLKIWSDELGADGSEYYNEQGTSSVIVGKNSTSRGTGSGSSGTDVSGKMDKSNPVGTGSMSMNRKSGTTVGTDSATFGNNNEASGYCSFAEGSSNTSSSNYSHAEGFGTVSAGSGTHSEGYQTKAYSTGDHAEGYNTTAGVSGSTNVTPSHAEGFDSTASNGGHAEGNDTTASGSYSHAEGYVTQATGKYSHSEGYTTKAIPTGTYGSAHAEGYLTTASGDASHSEGLSTTAGELTSHAEGYYSKASGQYSHAEGNNTTAAGSGAHSEGSSTNANGVNSHTEGDGTATTANDAHAEGYSTTASGFASHTEGNNTSASNSSAHAEGYHTKASGQYSHSGGNYTEAKYKSQTAIGEYNDSKDGDLFEIGNGTSSARSNIVEVTKTGTTVNGEITAVVSETAHTLSSKITESDANTLIATAIGKLTYLTKQVATQEEIDGYIAEPTTASFNVIYLLKDESATGTDKYFEYQRLGTDEESTFVCTGDTSTDLSDYAKKTDLPTKTSELTNDGDGTKPFLTEHQSLDEYAKKTDLPDAVSFSQIQTSGTHIADITIGETTTAIYAPEGGSSSLTELTEDEVNTIWSEVFE